MNISPRDHILSRVRSALAPLSVRAPLPDWDRELVARRGSDTSGGPARERRDQAANGGTDPWTLFADRLHTVNGTLFTSPAALVVYLTAQRFTHGYCDPGLLPQLASAFPATFTIETTFDRTRVDDYQFGITGAAGAIAETGTLILSDTTTSRRLGALAPWVHVALLRRDQLFADIPAAIAALPVDPNVIWVTGPSKTADVEGILIEGVHGPGVQAVLLVD